MKKLMMLGMLLAIAACQSAPPPKEVKEVYPYGLSEKEWNNLSVKDQTKMRRDFYFYERGQMNFVNPDIEIEGRKEQPHFRPQQGKTPAAGKAEE